MVNQWSNFSSDNCNNLYKYNGIQHTCGRIIFRKTLQYQHFITLGSSIGCVVSLCVIKYSSLHHNYPISPTAVLGHIILIIIRQDRSQWMVTIKANGFLWFFGLSCLLTSRHRINFVNSTKYDALTCCIGITRSDQND